MSTAWSRIVAAECKMEKLPIPTFEHRFDELAGRRWRFDLAWIPQRIAMEIDGGVYAQGRHTRGRGFEADCEKLNEALLQGWRVFRYSTGQVRQGIPILDLKRVFRL